MWLVALAQAEDLDALLARGELTLMETRADGRLEQATCFAQLHAPIDRVWSLLTDFTAYPTWMPQVRSVTVVSSTPTHVVADWTLSVVGPDISFRQEADLDPAAHTIHAWQVSGALPGSRWDWRLEPHGGGTLVQRIVHTNAVDSNWLLRQVDDDGHTLDYGINSATGVVEVKALERRLSGS